MDHPNVIRRYGDTDFVTALRALAATMVVIVHTGAFAYFGTVGQNITNAGKYGVQIFFVISGFSIATSLTGSVDYRGYLVRRLFRIVPLYWLMILATSAITLSGLLSPNYWSQYFGTDIDAYNLLMHLSFLSCFDHRIGTTVIGVEWTIPVEVFWYLVLPFVIQLMTNYQKRVIILFGSVAILGLTQIFARVFITDSPGLFTKWFPTSHGPYFLLGILAFQLRQNQDHWLHRSANRVLGVAWPIAGLHLLIGAPGLGVISAVLCVLTIGLFRTDKSSDWSRMATWGPFLFIGSISYSVYLVHFPILLVLKEYFGLVEGFMLFAVSYAVTLIVSAVLYLSVERPMNSWGKRFCKLLTQRSIDSTAGSLIGHPRAFEFADEVNSSYMIKANRCDERP